MVVQCANILKSDPTMCHFFLTNTRTCWNLLLYNQVLRAPFLLQDSVGFKGLHDLNHSLMVDQSSVCMNSDDPQDVDLELKL
jgi:hypothetical protein